MPISKQVKPHLVLPHEHALSLSLASQAWELAANIRRQATTDSKATSTGRQEQSSFLSHVQSCRVLSPGLVELVIQLVALGEDNGTNAMNGYASRPWPVRVGGAGIGDDFNFDTNPALAAMLGGGTRRAPVAVRFTVPIALPGVDDAGFFDSSFFESNDANTLQGIAETVVSWLQGSHLLTNCGAPPSNHQQRREDWHTAEQHTSKRLHVMRQYMDVMESRGDASLLLPVLDFASSNKQRRYIQPDWISPDFRSCFAVVDDDDATLPKSIDDWKRIVTEIGPGIYSFPLFSDEFCDLLVEEVDAFESTSLPCRRPNTMNRLGLVVNDIGLEPFMTDLVELLLAPMCAALYPEEVITCALDHHHSFVVRYKNDDHKEDKNGSSNSNDHDYNNKGLDMHHDASEATLNVCLGRDNFTSGGLRFCGRFGDSDHRIASHVYSHSKGRAILHLGRHRHGADDISGSSAERMNLIVWARNSAYRGAAAFGHVPLDGSPIEKEAGEPDRLCLSKANDRDYEEQMKRFDTGSSNNASGSNIKRRRRVATKF